MTALVAHFSGGINHIVIFIALRCFRDKATPHSVGFMNSKFVGLLFSCSAR